MGGSRVGFACCWEDLGWLGPGWEGSGWEGPVGVGPGGLDAAIFVTGSQCLINIFLQIDTDNKIMRQTIGVRGCHF